MITSRERIKQAVLRMGLRGPMVPSVSLDVIVNELEFICRTEAVSEARLAVAATRADLHLREPQEATTSVTRAAQARVKQLQLAFEITQKGRLARARRLAHHVYEMRTLSGGAGIELGTAITVADVKKAWVQRYGKDSWRDSKGNCYWAGGIFAGKEWEPVGYTHSPDNNNSSNRLWKRVRKT